MCTNSAGRSPNTSLKKTKNSITARLKDGDKDGRPVEVAMFTSSADSLGCGALEASLWAGMNFNVSAVCRNIKHDWADTTPVR